jgi:hypothetical protein
VAFLQQAVAMCAAPACPRADVLGLGDDPLGLLETAGEQRERAAHEPHAPRQRGLAQASREQLGFVELVGSRSRMPELEQVDGAHDAALELDLAVFGLARERGDRARDREAFVDHLGNVDRHVPGGERVGAVCGPAILVRQRHRLLGQRPRPLRLAHEVQLAGEPCEQPCL